MNELKNVLASALQEIPTNFSDNELAFLALTGKIERPISDKVAWRLHTWALTRDFAATREWGRGRDITQTSQYWMVIRPKPSSNSKRCSHSTAEEQKKDERNLEDWEPVHDSIGVTYWLPPTCRNCDD